MNRTPAIDPAVFAGFSRLTVGVSGGADSLALLLLTREAAEIPVEAVHFEHGLRGGDSLADARAVEAFCRRQNLPCRIIPLRIPPGNTEANAREQRFAALERIVPPDGAAVLGHHADDLAENLLLRLARGSNVSGLTGLRLHSRIGRLHVLRPLLKFHKSELEAWLRARGVEWRTDQTNADCAFRRNFLRNRLLPELYTVLPFAREGFAAAARALEIDADFLERAAEAEYVKICGRRRTAVAFWQNLHPALRQRVLRRYLSDRLGREFIPDTRFAARFADGGAGTLEIAGNRWVCAGASRLWPAPAVPWHELENPMEFEGERFSAEPVDSRPETVGNDEAYFDARVLDTPLSFDFRREGDKLAPFGTNRPRPLAELGIPGDAVLLRSGERILWVPGFRRSNLAPVRPGSPALRLRRRVQPSSC